MVVVMMEREDFFTASELMEIEKDGLLTSFELQKELEFQKELNNNYYPKQK